MAKGKDKNYVSFGFWMFALFVMALPCVGFVMVIVWAFIGENETRKNYFRATIAWFLILAALWTGLMVAGFWPAIVDYGKARLDGWKPDAHRAPSKR